MDTCTKLYQSASDFELINYILSGDGKAIEYLLVNQCGRAFKFLCLKNQAAGLDLEDLIQDVAVKLISNDYKALRNFQGKNSDTGQKCGLDRYIFVIARNHIQYLNKKAMTEVGAVRTRTNKGGSNCTSSSTSAYDYERGSSQKVRREINWSLALVDKEGKPIDVVDPKWKIGKTAMEIMEAIMSLEDSREKYVLIEYKIKGHTPDEVAAALGTTEGNVYTLCSRAQKKLRRLLISEGVTHAGLSN